MKAKNGIGIIVFTISCVMLISGIIFFESFSIFKVNQNIIKEDIESINGTEFAFFVNDTPSNTIPEKRVNYSLDTYKSKCYDSTTGDQLSNVSWDNEKWKVILKEITNTKTKCELYFDDIYIDETLKQAGGSIGPIPDLGNGRLVPIRIDSTSGTPVVKKANIFEKWYSYAEREWANAVILRDGVEDNYSPGQEIEEADIESYFVWIPRYRYQLQDDENTFNSYQTAANLGNFSNVSDVYEAMKQTNTDGNKATNHAFEIEFETKEQKVSITTQSGQYLTHPAFTSFNSNGFWVGKFETSNSGSADNNSISPEAVQIKPNVSSWREIQPANAFYTSYNYQRELESHMMKNMEWGAVAYLSQSKYGRCDSNNKNCTEVRINNNSDYKTGSSAVNAPTCGYSETSISCNQYGTDTSIVNNYNTLESVVSSTTNNYYGIYDMSGGSHEYVMGVMVDESGKPASGENETSNSGFNGPYTDTNGIKENGKLWPSSRYYDLYDYATTDQNYNRGKLGDGTKEFGPFYKVSFNGSTSQRSVGSYNADEAFFAHNNGPWFIRGGTIADGTSAGPASFGNTWGKEYDSCGFRIVLTP